MSHVILSKIIRDGLIIFRMWSRSSSPVFLAAWFSGLHLKFRSVLRAILNVNIFLLQGLASRWFPTAGVTFVCYILNPTPFIRYAYLSKEWADYQPSNLSRWLLCDFPYCLSFAFDGLKLSVSLRRDYKFNKQRGSHLDLELTLALRWLLITCLSTSALWRCLCCRHLPLASTQRSTQTSSLLHWILALGVWMLCN